jgi:hypothetical protein
MAENTDPYKQSLDSRALSVATLLEKLRKSLTYNSIQKTTPALSENDIVLLLDPERQGGSSLHCCKSCKTKGQVASATKRYTKKCRSLYGKMSRTKIPGVVDLSTSSKKVGWEMSLYLLSS